VADVAGGSGAPISRPDLTVPGEATGWTASNILSGVIVTEGRVPTPQAGRAGFEITNNRGSSWRLGRVNSFANGWENASVRLYDEAAYLKDAEAVHIRGFLGSCRLGGKALSLPLPLRKYNILPGLMGTTVQAPAMIDPGGGCTRSGKCWRRVRDRHLVQT
jgi:hypothetical protein